MTTIQQHLTTKPRNNLSVYFTAGYPTVGATAEIILALQENGIDFIEVGMPFSDPVADGPVIAAAHTKALTNGMTLDRLFCEVISIKAQLTVPLIYMGYLNIIYQYGLEKFCQKCQEAGFSGAIVPDLPFDIYPQHYQPIFSRYNIAYIPLVTPETTRERVRLIGEHSDSFIYLVSSVATTGYGSDAVVMESLQKCCAIINNKPVMIGFGVDNRSKRRSMSEFSAGVIVGSAFIRLLEANPVSVAVKRLLEQLS